MNPDFTKYPDSLVPAIVQDAVSQKVLMLGFMNEEALKKTKAEGRVTFFSRSKQRLWTKGETSVITSYSIHYTKLYEVAEDLDAHKNAVAIRLNK